MFSILIPTWNNLPYLQYCVRSIRNHSAFAHQIIVHINDGHDGTREWITEQGIEHTASDANIGICYAVNLAASRARRDYIVYLNDDMVCCPNWDTALLERIKQIGHTMFMLSGTMIEPVEGNPCVVASDFGRDIQTFREAELLECAPSLIRADWYGATWPPTVVHRDDWFKVGGYSSEFSPGMGSDNDFSIKMWHAGCRIFLGVGTSLVYHFQQKSTQRLIKKNKRRRQFLYKWGICSSDFNRLYLRRGAPVKAGQSALLDMPPFTPALRWALLKSRIQRLFLALSCSET